VRASPFRAEGVGLETVIAAVIKFVELDNFSNTYFDRCNTEASAF